jgi:peptide/nickel transport system substrate-binding protein
LFGGIGVNKAVNSLNPPILANYSDQSAFSKYKLDLKMVNKLMTGDGWKKNSSGTWEKGGKAADIEMKSTTGNKRRELTEQILQAQVGKAGFNLTINNQSAGDLFGKQLPAGDYQLALYAQVATSLEPGLCAVMCSKNIPTAANNNTGQNWTRSNVKGLDKPLEVVDNSSNDAARIKAAKVADKLMANAVVSLPLDPLPNISLWSKKLKGPKPDDPILAMFFNLGTWTTK